MTKRYVEMAISLAKERTKTFVAPVTGVPSKEHCQRSAVNATNVVVLFLQSPLSSCVVSKKLVLAIMEMFAV